MQREGLDVVLAQRPNDASISSAVITMSPLTIAPRSPIGSKKATRGSTRAVPDNRGPGPPARCHRLAGLCFLRLTWQHTGASALLGWAKDDAEYIAHQIDVGG